MAQASRVMRELHRRRVFRMVAAYSVIAFVMLQVIDLGTSAWGIPAATLTIAVWVAIVGVPVVGILAWIFDITPWGILKTPPTGMLPKQPTGLIDRRVEFIIIVALLVAMGFGIGGMIADLESRRPAAVDQVDGVDQVDRVD